jgi:hypothetical protein
MADPPTSIHIDNGHVYDQNGKQLFVDSGGGIVDDIGGLFDRINPLDTIKDSTSAVVTAGKTLVAAERWIADRDNWIRIVKVLIGFGFIIQGVAMLANKSLAPDAMAALTKVK